MASQSLDFILNFVDKMSTPLSKVCKTITNAQKIANSGFDTAKNSIATLYTNLGSLKTIINPSRDYYKALGEVKSLNIAQEELDNLGQAAKNFQNQTGKSASDFIRSSYDIQSAIPDLAQGALASFTTAANITAIATKSSASEITSYIGTMYGIFEKQANQLGQAQWVDALMGKTAAAVQIFKTTGSAMSAAFTNIGSSATNLGIKLDEQIAVLGTLQATMGGERAGSAYAALIRAIPTAQAKGTINLKDQTGNAQPIIQIIDQLKQKYSHLDTLSRSNAIANLFGSSEAVKVIENLWDKTEKLNQSIQSISQINNLDYAKKMAASMTDSIDKMQGKIQTLKLNLSIALEPIVTTISNLISRITEKISNLITQYPMISQIITAITAIIIITTTALSSFTLAIGILKIIWGSTLMSLAYGVKIIHTIKYAIFLAQYYTTIWGIKTKLLTTWQTISNTLTQKGAAWLYIKNTAQKIHNLLLSISTTNLFKNTTATHTLTLAQTKTIITEKLHTLLIGAKNALLIASKIILITAAIPALLAYAATLGISKIAIIAMKAAVWLLNTALLACPLTWIILGIAAIIGIIILLIKNFHHVKAAAVWCFQAISNAISYCWEKIKQLFTYLWDLSSRIRQTIGNTIKSTFSSIWETISSIWDKISPIFTLLTSFFSSDKDTQVDLNKNINQTLSTTPTPPPIDTISPRFQKQQTITSQIQKTTNYENININVKNGFTPAQLNEFQALQA